MIGDVLFDAIVEIERYQQLHPDEYQGISVFVAEIKTTLRAYLQKLDDPDWSPILNPQINPTIISRGRRG